MATLENSLLSWLSLQLDDNGRGADEVTNKMLDRHRTVNEFKNKMIDSDQKQNFTRAQVFGTFGPQYESLESIIVASDSQCVCSDTLM